MNNLNNNLILKEKVKAIVLNTIQSQMNGHLEYFKNVPASRLYSQDFAEDKVNRLMNNKTNIFKSTIDLPNFVNKDIEYLGYDSYLYTLTFCFQCLPETHNFILEQAFKSVENHFNEMSVDFSFSCTSLHTEDAEFFKNITQNCTQVKLTFSNYKNKMLVNYLFAEAIACFNHFFNQVKNLLIDTYDEEKTIPNLLNAYEQSTFFYNQHNILEHYKNNQSNEKLKFINENKDKLFFLKNNSHQEQQDTIKKHQQEYFKRDYLNELSSISLKSL